MQRAFLIILFTACVCIFWSCKVDNSAIPATTLNYTYQPVTAGSAWIYKNTDSLTTDTSTVVMTGVTKTIGGNLAHLALTHRSNGIDSGYYSLTDHIYRTIDSQTGLALPYLNDAREVGQTWGSTLNEYGQTINITGKVMEKDINKTVLSKSYQHVIHTRLVFQINADAADYGLSIGRDNIYDFYIAPNVGIIEIDNINPVNFSRSELLSYTVK